MLVPDEPTLRVLEKDGTFAYVSRDPSGAVDQDLLCPKCAYNLRGLQPGSACPECGAVVLRSLLRAIDTEGTFAAIKRDASGTLVQDVPCLKCEYNLRGLTAERTCPECGTPVARSMHGTSLRACEPGWLRKLSRGCWYLWASELALAAFVISLIVAAVHENGPAGIASIALLVTCVVTAWWGCWVVTSPEWHPLRQEPRLSSRRVFRWVFAVALAAWFAAAYGWFFYVTYHGPPSGRGGRSNDVIVPVIMFAMILLTVLAPLLAFLLHMRQIARRLGERVLSHITLAITLWLALVLIALECLQLINAIFIEHFDAITQITNKWGLFARGLSAARIGHIIATSTVVSALSLALTLLAGLAVLPWYARRLRHAAAIAEATWAQPGKAPSASSPHP